MTRAFRSGPRPSPTKAMIEDQNEELAKLRDNTSIEKTILSKSIPNVDKMMPSVEIEKYEGENR